ncbi:hypothetical protein D1222_08140 [Henriciella algicola]|uniref:Transposase n=2 Tax=Henriciella algicola TaxID=1608422 RepID=A0A399RIF9_9PROT|nr:hypothetical protein D1222_08140 [Henriciella algicola]
MRRYETQKTVLTHRLRFCGTAMKKIGNLGRHLNNRAGNSHLPFRCRERAMSKFQKISNLQKFASTHGSLRNRFNLYRHRKTRSHFKQNRDAAVLEYRQLL